MLVYKLLKRIFLTFLLISPLTTQSFNMSSLTALITVPSLFNKTTKHKKHFIKVTNDLEENLEYVLGINSLEELTNQLSVYANSIYLPQSNVSIVPIKDNLCSFSIQIPLNSLLCILQKNKAQALWNAYENTIAEYINQNINSYYIDFYKNHHKDYWFKTLLTLFKIEINFTYHVTNEEIKKECLSLLAIILRKKTELEKLIDTQLTTNLLYYTFPRTFVINLNS